MTDGSGARVALVTGGGSGIGAATVSLLRDRGVHVAVMDLALDALAAGPEVLACPGDVTVRDEVDATVAAVVEHFGRLDILVCAAGIPGQTRSPLDATDDEWERVMGVNAGGTFYACRAAARVMVAHGYGRIVNVASIAGQRGHPSLLAYAASKAAVIAMTQSFGVALGGTGVLVNCVTPGVIRTPLLGDLDPASVAAMVSRMPLGRMGEPVEIARLIAFLASDDLTFTTGACFDASAGRTLS